MFRNAAFLLTFAAATSLAAASPAFAQAAPGAPAAVKAANTDPNAAKAPGPLAELMLGYELFSLGKKTKDPLVVIAAARVVAGVPTQERERKAEDVGEATSNDEGDADKPTDLAQILATAREMAKGDKTLLALAEDVQASASKGRLHGPSKTVDRVSAGRQKKYADDFRGGEQAAILLVGDGDTVLDLYVTDANGNQVCNSGATGKISDQWYCAWTPLYTGTFYIWVVNRGNVRNSYTIVTN